MFFCIIPFLLEKYLNSNFVDHESAKVGIVNQVEIGNKVTTVNEGGIVIKGAEIVIDSMTVIVAIIVSVIGKESDPTAMILGVAADHAHVQKNVLETMIATGMSMLPF